VPGSLVGDMLSTTPGASDGRAVRCAASPSRSPTTARDDVVVRTEGLTKSFGDVVAVDHLDLELHRGEVFGYLGPNGAGKTTTLRLLLGLLRPTSGTATVLGLDPWADTVELHRRIAYVPGEFAVWPALTGAEMLDLLGNLHGGWDERRRAELCERFEFDPSRKGRTYSRGNRQKIALIAALIGVSRSGLTRLAARRRRRGAVRRGAGDR
jgi:ABC-2 type transport system ATP-binding protein